MKMRRQVEAGRPVARYKMVQKLDPTFFQLFASLFDLSNSMFKEGPTQPLNWRDVDVVF